MTGGPADEDVSGHAGDWTPEQVGLASIYGTCRTCGAPRKSVTVERSPSNWHAALACLNGHGEGDC